MTLFTLKKLEGEATEGPWVSESYCIAAPVKGGRPNGEVIASCIPSIHGLLTHKQREDNAALIVALRNNARALIEVAEALKAVADSYHFSEFMRTHSPEERDQKFAEEVPEYGKDCDEIHSVTVKVRAALTRLEGGKE